MRVLVIFAHPVPDSYVAALHRTVVKALSDSGHEVRDTDLYAEGFEPVLTESERRAYHDIGANTQTIERYVNDLGWADSIVFVFPTWWYGLPAILKGYLDRVWVPGVAFHLPTGRGPIAPGLPNIKKLGIVTTYGAPWWFIHLWVRGAARTVLIRGLKPLFARGCGHLYLALHGMDTVGAERRRRFLDRVDAAFRRF